MHKILIIEDEVQIARGLELELKYENYSCKLIHDGKEGLEHILTNEYDVILLDLMLPSMSGIEVLRKMRKCKVITPVIILTAKDTTMDKVIGLDQGANDYLAKPFEMEELLARIRSLIRYNDLVKQVTKISKDEERLSAGKISLHRLTRELEFNGIKTILTPKEYDVLLMLIENKNRIISREEIVKQIWGMTPECETNVLDVYIRHLRKKIDSENIGKYIQTVHGVGYIIKDTNEDS